MPTQALKDAATDPYADIATPIQSTPTASASAPAAADSSDPYADIATPIPTKTEQPGVIDRAITGAKQFAKPIMDLVSPPTSPTEALLNHVGAGAPALAAYRIAKGVVDSADNLVKSGPGKFEQAKSDFSQTVKDFHNKDYRDMLVDAMNSAQDVTPAIVPGGVSAREETEGLRKDGNLVTPLVRDALTAGTVLATGLKNPFRAAAEATPAEAAAATSKIEPAVAARTAKAGLAPGEEGMTAEAARAATKQSALDAQAATQKNVDSALQDIAGQHAKANGIPAPAAGTATRDVLTANGDALVDAGKANYKILDKYTDGKFTNTQAELKNAQQELRMKAGMTGVDTGDLEANVLRAQMKVDQLFDDAVQAGMPKDTAELARTQFKTGQATLDAANDVRMANRVTGAGQRATNLNALENRWQARYDAGRLQQAFGEDGAKAALTRIHAAREAAEVFDAMPPTESKALQELISQNTTTGKFMTTTNWAKVQDAFSKLPDRAARFSDVPKVERFINNQKYYQWLIRGAAGAVPAATGVYEWATH